MKIRTQSILLFFFGFIVIGFSGFLIIHQISLSRDITQEVTEHQNGLIILNDFQVAANNQILYGMDLVRTGDISGERIIPYRMTETRFSREIANLDQLHELLDEDFAPIIRSLTERGEELAKLCKDELIGPLYSHQPLKEGIIEQLIYKELDGLEEDSNTLRTHLDERIRLDVQRQEVQRKKLTILYLPLAGGLLFLFFLLSYAIIHRSVSSINKTRVFLGTLAEGQSRLDVSLPEGGRDEVTELCRNFNRFMENLNSRHQALKQIADEQVLSGQELNRVSLEHASAVTQINQSLNLVHQHTTDMAGQVDSSAGEVRRIAETLDSLEHMSREQESRVSGMVHRGTQVYDSMASQQAAIAQQVTLTEQVKKEGENNRKILELLKKQIVDILKQSDEISGAILSIQDLADQTDILAVNASIEAAHAGSLGAGFSVVSGEMRSLSNQVRQNTAWVIELLANLNGKLQLMADEERQNRASINRLIKQNRDAENVILKLESSMKSIQNVISDFFAVLEEVRSGSSLVHSETELVRSSGIQINLHMDEIREKQTELINEWSEMNQGVNQLTRGTDSLHGLSDRNSRSASVLNEEIKRLGS